MAAGLARCLRPAGTEGRIHPPSQRLGRHRPARARIDRAIHPPARRFVILALAVANTAGVGKGIAPAQPERFPLHHPSPRDLIPGPMPPVPAWARLRFAHPTLRSLVSSSGQARE
jgi:hypothetical protein